MTQLLDLGLVKALHVGPTAPLNKKLLWNDTNVTTKSPFRYFHEPSQTWKFVEQEELWQFDFTASTTLTRRIPFSCRIVAIDNIHFNPISTILVDGIAHPLNTTISKGQLLSITSSLLGASVGLYVLRS